MNRMWAVFRKEMIDSLRDRRAMLSALLFPLIGPLMAAMVVTLATKQAGTEKPLELAIIGQHNAPELVSYLKEQNVRIVEGPADPMAAIRDGQNTVVLIIPNDFAEKFRAGKPAPLQLIADQSRDDSRVAVRRANRVLGVYSATVGSYRLLLRGVSPELVQPLQIHQVDLATPRQLAARLFGMIPMFVLLGAFLGGMYVATDSTAGERERGSLEPLLINPVPRRQLVYGKWLAAVVFSSATIILTLVGSLVALSHVPTEELGIKLELSALEVTGVVLATLPVALFASAVQMLVATFARSFKEAQTYLSLMIMGPMLPGALLTVIPVNSAPWMFAVPVFGQQILHMDVLKGEPLSIMSYLLAALSATVMAMVCVRGRAKLFQRERIIFGR
jgi:sodium transport system permease protein